LKLLVSVESFVGYQGFYALLREIPYVLLLLLLLLLLLQAPHVCSNPTAGTCAEGGRKSES
jgi:hypothetical protein